MAGVFHFVVLLPWRFIHYEGGDVYGLMQMTLKYSDRADSFISNTIMDKK